MCITKYNQHKLQKVFWTCFATLNGGIFFREFFGEVFLSHKIYGFVSGMSVIFLGVYLLAPSQDTPPHESSCELRKMHASTSPSSTSSSSSNITYEKLSQHDLNRQHVDKQECLKSSSSFSTLSRVSTFSSSSMHEDQLTNSVDLENGQTDVSDTDRGRSRSVSELLEGAKVLLFGQEEEAVEMGLESFAPTLNGLMSNDSDTSSTDEDT